MSKARKKTKQTKTNSEFDSLYKILNPKSSTKSQTTDWPLLLKNYD